MGLVAEAIALGTDVGATMNDTAFSSPGTDVIDVGSDMLNSELFNSLLVTADICDTGIISEEALRRVYDAYAHASARMWNEFWGNLGPVWRQHC